MSLYKSKELIRRRKAGGGYVKGQWVPGEPSDKDFRGTWQPASGNMLELLPEGKRSREVYKCYAPIEMDFTSADEHGEKEADLIVCNGKEFEVTTAARFDNSPFPRVHHWRLLCTRPKAGEK